MTMMPEPPPDNVLDWRSSFTSPTPTPTPTPQAPSPGDASMWSNMEKIASMSAPDRSQQRGLDGLTDAERGAVTRYNMHNRSEFTRGMIAAVDDTQGSLYGAVGALGSLADNVGIPGGAAVRDFGLENYRANQMEASVNPRRVASLGDIKNVGDVGTFAAGTLGSLVPFMAEVAASSMIGAALGTAVEPGGGTAVGAVVGAIGRKSGKEMIESLATRYMARGMAEGAAKHQAEQMIIRQAARKAVQDVGVDAAESYWIRQGMRQIGSRIGQSLASSANEAGAMYADGVEHGYDAPGTALALGALSGSLELFGGNSRLVTKVLGGGAGREFNRALREGKIQIASRIMMSLAQQGGEEALQEMGQETISMAHQWLNDPDFNWLTDETAARLANAGAAGFIGGIAGGGVGAALDARNSEDPNAPPPEWNEYNKPAGPNGPPAPPPIRPIVFGPNGGVSPTRPGLERPAIPVNGGAMNFGPQPGPTAIGGQQSHMLGASQPANLLLPPSNGTPPRGRRSGPLDAILQEDDDFNTVRQQYLLPPASTKPQESAMPTEGRKPDGPVVGNPYMRVPIELAKLHAGRGIASAQQALEARTDELIASTRQKQEQAQAELGAAFRREMERRAEFDAFEQKVYQHLQDTGMLQDFQREGRFDKLVGMVQENDIDGARKALAQIAIDAARRVDRDGPPASRETLQALLQLPTTELRDRVKQFGLSPQGGRRQLARRLGALMDMLDTARQEERAQRASIAMDETLQNPPMDQGEQRVVDSLRNLPERKPEGLETAPPQFDEMVAAAARWRSAAMNASRAYEGDSKAGLKHSQATTKAALDAYIMKRFGVDSAEARSVSNELTRTNTPADPSVGFDEFTETEPWARAAADRQATAKQEYDIADEFDRTMMAMDLMEDIKKKAIDRLRDKFFADGGLSHTTDSGMTYILHQSTRGKDGVKLQLSVLTPDGKPWGHTDILDDGDYMDRGIELFLDDSGYPIREDLEGVNATQIADAYPGREYRYESTLRPLTIGAYPKDNLVRTERGGERGHGIAVYNFPLSQERVDHFDFKPLAPAKSESPAPAKKAKPDAPTAPPDYSTMKVPELKDEIRKRGYNVPRDGKREPLMKRLEAIDRGERIPDHEPGDTVFFWLKDPNSGGIPHSGTVLAWTGNDYQIQEVQNDKAREHFIRPDRVKALPATLGRRQRAAELAALPADQRKQVTEQAREFDQLVQQIPEVSEALAAMSGKGRAEAQAVSQVIRQGREQFAEALGVKEDIHSVVQRASHVEALRTWLKTYQGDVATDRVAEAKASIEGKPGKRVWAGEVADGDQVMVDGQWRIAEVDEAEGVLRLMDGTEIEIDRAEDFTADDGKIISPDGTVRDATTPEDAATNNEWVTGENATDFNVEDMGADFGLQSQSEQDVAADREKAAAKARLEDAKRRVDDRLQNAQAGEMGTPDMFDPTAGDTALFDQPADQDEDVPFKKQESTATTGQTAKSLRKQMRRLPKDAEIVDSFTDLPEAARRRALAQFGTGDGIQGVYLNGKVYLVADKLADVNEAARVMLHELIAHKGMREVFGMEFGQVLDEIGASLGDKLKGVASRYNLDLGTEAGRRQAVDEYIAEQAESNRKPSWWRRVVRMVKSWLRNHGINAKYTQGDIDAILQAVKDRRAQVEKESGRRLAKQEDVIAFMADKDGAYMAAVERGDMDAARKMVDAAAKAAGYDIKAYHGTDASLFTVFNTDRDVRDRGKTTDPNAFVGSHFASDRNIADRFSDELYGAKGGRTMPVYLRFKNPLQAGEGKPNVVTMAALRATAEKAKAMYDAHANERAGRGRSDAELAELRAALEANDDAKVDELLADPEGSRLYDEWQQATEPMRQMVEDNRPIREEELYAIIGMDIDAVHRGWTQAQSKKSYAAKIGKRIRAALLKRGYDGVYYTNAISSEHGLSLDKDTYIALHPSQIKSADPVVRDDNGRIVPLSERFNPENNDIRFKQRPSTAPSADAIAEGQKMSDAEYLGYGESTMSAWGKTKQAARAIGFQETFERLTYTVSERLRRIDEGLLRKFRDWRNDMEQGTNRDLAPLESFFKSARKAMNKTDLRILKLAMMLGDAKKIQRMLAQHDGLTDAYAAARKVIDAMPERLKEVGLDINQLPEYWPRRVKDVKGLISYLKQEKPTEWSWIQRALDEKQAARPDEALTDEETAHIVNQLLRGFNDQGRIGLDRPSNAKERKLDVIPAEAVDRFYMDPFQATFRYISEANKQIAWRKLLGKTTTKADYMRKSQTRYRQYLSKIKQAIQEATDAGDIDAANALDKRRQRAVGRLLAIDKTLADIAATEGIHPYHNLENSIGMYTSRLLEKGKIGAEQEEELKAVMHALYVDRGPGQKMQALRELAYIDSMGQFSSALTQIGDLAWSAYRAGLGNTFSALWDAALNKSEIKRDDIVRDIADEFRSDSVLSKVLDTTFHLTGMHWMDRVGKETLMNASVKNTRQLIRQAKAGDKAAEAKIRGRLEQVFGNAWRKAMLDIADPGADGKVNNTLQRFAFDELSEFQPVTQLELPEGYLTAGNGRIFYMLKTFTIKQFSVYRQQVYNRGKKAIREKDWPAAAEAAKDAMRMAVMFTMAGATANALKDFLYGRPVNPDEVLMDSAWSLTGMSRYDLYTVRNEGPMTAAYKRFIPPHNAMDQLYKQFIGGEAYNEGANRAISLIPVVGKLFWWHMREDTGASKDNAGWGNGPGASAWK